MDPNLKLPSKISFRPTYWRFKKLELMLNRRIFVSTQYGRSGNELSWDNWYQSHADCLDEPNIFGMILPWATEFNTKFDTAVERYVNQTDNNGDWDNTAYNYAVSGGRVAPNWTIEEFEAYMLEFIEMQRPDIEKLGVVNADWVYWMYNALLQLGWVLNTATRDISNKRYTKGRIIGPVGPESAFIAEWNNTNSEVRNGQGPQFHEVWFADRGPLGWITPELTFINNANCWVPQTDQTTTALSADMYVKCSRADLVLGPLTRTNWTRISNSPLNQTAYYEWWPIAFEEYDDVINNYDFIGAAVNTTSLFFGLYSWDILTKYSFGPE